MSSTSRSGSTLIGMKGPKLGVGVADEGDGAAGLRGNEKLERREPSSVLAGDEDVCEPPPVGEKFPPNRGGGGKGNATAAGDAEGEMPFILFK